VVDKKPRFTKAWNNISALLNALEHYEEASFCWERALILRPDYGMALKINSLVSLS
jgi:tetratricopeptide (TPR) repeat protein